jgi:hypothetical protein
MLAGLLAAAAAPAAGDAAGDELPPPPQPAKIAVIKIDNDHTIGLLILSNFFILILLIFRKKH